MTAPHTRMRVNRLWLLVVLLLLTACAQRPTPTPPLNPSSASIGAEKETVKIEITYPTANTSLNGTVEIVGSVTHPDLNAYGLIYGQTQPHTASTNWQVQAPIVWDVKHQVTQGVLGVWDTTQCPDGHYALSLVVYEIGKTEPISYTVENLTVQNQIRSTPQPDVETDDIHISITYPTAGATLSGTVDIEGTVEHPNLKAYGIVYTTDKYHTENSAWRLDDPIAWNVATPITDGILGTWNTTEYPNGSYALLLTVYEMGGNEPLVYFVDNLTIANEITPTPTPAPVSVPTPLPFATPTGLKQRDTFALGGYLRTAEHWNALRYAGMTWLKMPEPYPDNVAGSIKTNHDLGFKVLLTAFSNAEMVLSDTFIDDYTAWVAALAAAGADAIEVWREPNVDRSWAGDIDPAAYTRLLCAAYKAIKEANPQTYVISAAPVPTGWFKGCSAAGCDDLPWLAGLYAAGAAQCMDYIGAQYVSGATSPSARTGHPGAAGDDYHSWYFLPQTEAYYQAFHGTRQLFYTALGYASQEGVPAFSTPFAWAKGITNAQQAEWLAEAVQLALDSEMVRGIMIWNIDFKRYGSDPQDGYAIVRPDDSCPACVKLHEVLSQP